MNMRLLTFMVLILSLVSGCANPARTEIIPNNTLTSQVTSTPSSTTRPAVQKTLEKDLAELDPVATYTPGPPTATPTATITPTPTVTLTSTAQPPLAAHTWELDPILIQMETSSGDGCCTYTSPPELVLYANGLFIRAGYENNRYAMLARKLDRQEMCALLNTIDQAGFFDYDPSVYQDPMDGLAITSISIHAWRKQMIYGQVLRTWIYEGGDWWRKTCDSPDCAPPPVILPALANTYQLLDQYDPGGLEILPARQWLVWLDPEPKDYTPKPWPISGFSLETLVKAAEQNEDLLVIVDDPAKIEAIQKNLEWGKYYGDGEMKRTVYARPLWPYESHLLSYAPGIPTALPVAGAGATLTCNPEDGILPIP